MIHCFIKQINKTEPVFNNRETVGRCYCSLEFPEQEGELSPVIGSFGIEKDNKDFFPVKGQIIKDPNSAFKWEYTIEYKEKEGYNQEGDVFSAGKKEKTRASIKILSLY